jgi:outer membrane protein assembly factor BamB
MNRFAILLFVPFLIAADWPQHFGPNRDSHSPEAGLARTWPKEGPPQVWKYDVGVGWAGPVVAGERLIMFHRLENQEIVECLDMTGKQKWKSNYRTKYSDDFNFDDGPRSTPLIADKKVFTLGADGELRAWELETGKAIWDRNINTDYKVEKGYFGVATSPIIVGGHLLINVGVKGAGVVAFDPATGKEVWKASNDGVSYSSPVAAKVGGEELAIFFTRAGLLAIEPTAGKVRYAHPWRPRLNASVNAATPIVVGDRMYISTSYSTGAIVLEAKKGELKEVWSGDDSLSNHFNTPVYIQGYLYGIDGRQEAGARLRCVEWDTGKVRWTQEKFGCAGLIAVDGLLIATTENGDVVLIEPNAERYKELGRAKVLDSPVRAMPALAGGKLFVRDKTKLVALDVMKK